MANFSFIFNYLSLRAPFRLKANNSGHKAFSIA
jgi:hypothetical protein